MLDIFCLQITKVKESLADAKVSERAQCVYEGPYSEEICSKSTNIMRFPIDG